MAIRNFWVKVLWISATTISPHAMSATTFKSLYSFPNGGGGTVPFAGLLNVGGTLYGTTAYGGTAGRGTVFTVDPGTNSETIVHNFGGASDGAGPEASLVKLGNTLYGTTTYGGTANLGTIYSLDPGTGIETVVYSFTSAAGSAPQGALLAVGGVFYGTTYSGGSAGYGTVYKFDPKTSVETTLYSFLGGGDGTNPQAALINVGGTLYGTASAGGSANAGTVFAINPTTGTETTLHSFTANSSDGGAPIAELVNVSGTLYGTTLFGGANFAGTVFKINPHSGKESLSYSFSGAAEGGGPNGGLLSLGGVLYGVTGYGGASGFGTVFALNQKTNAESTLYAFTGNFDGGDPQCTLITSGNTLYGTSVGSRKSGPLNGSVFAINLSGNSESTLYTFYGQSVFGNSNSALSPSGGILYGTSAAGGAMYGGLVFGLNPNSGAEMNLYSFQGFSDGAFPSGPLLPVGGILYGENTYSNSGYNTGNLFKIDPTTGTETTLYTFTGGADGGTPNGGLLNVKGVLYGTTATGGANGAGTAFEFVAATSSLTTLHSFGGANDGSGPRSGLIDVNGTLYGTTLNGGASFYGTVFSIDPSTGAERVVYAFTGGNDGGLPSGLIAYKGSLYGTTNLGGFPAPACQGAGCGVIFKVAPKSGAETVLHAFNGGSDGYFPIGGLIASKSTIYGTASSGGLAGAGTLFTLNPTTGAINTIYNFTGGNDGGGPESALVQVGKTFYGSTNFGGTGNLGTLFSVKP